MKGYHIDIGYRGYVPSEGYYMLFSTEQEYEEYFMEHNQ